MLTNLIATIQAWLLRLWQLWIRGESAEQTVSPQTRPAGTTRYTTPELQWPSRPCFRSSYVPCELAATHPNFKHWFPSGFG